MAGGEIAVVLVGRIVQLGHHGVSDRRPLANREGLALKVLVEDREGVVEAPAKNRSAQRIG